MAYRYSSESHQLMEDTLQKLIEKYGSLAYPKMVGYLMVNIPLEDAKRIAKLVEDNL